MAVCLEQGANNLHMVQLMPLPLHQLCLSKIQKGPEWFIILVLAHLSSLETKGRKTIVVTVVVVVLLRINAKPSCTWKMAVKLVFCVQVL